MFLVHRSHGSRRSQQSYHFIHLQSIGAVGYCFGGKYVVRHLQPDADKIDCGYIAHPSYVSTEELRAIKGPLSIAAAETDSIFPSEKRHESEAILKDIGLPYQVNLYSGVAHG
jgi:dienelactone hydrolase